MVSYRDFALEVLGPITMLPMLEVPVTDALGCRAALAVAADRAVPPFRQGAIDGVGVAAADASAATSSTPVIIPLAGISETGPSRGRVPTGHCIRVAPGAPLPSGVTAVVPIADCVIEADKVILSRAPIPGEGIHEAGSQFVKGESVVADGQQLGHVAIAQLALLGRSRVQVHPRPRVIVITIGSELVAVSSPAGDGQIHDATGVLLTTTARRLGAACYRIGPIPDDPRAVRDAIEDQLVRADVIVTAGGIDTDDDVLREVLIDAGIARFDGPSLAPCGPYGIGRIGPDQTPIVALPGEPAVALLAFHALARPVIMAMLGRDNDRWDALIPPPRHAAIGARVTPGRVVDGRFVAVGAEPPSLRDLSSVTAIAIHHAGEQSAEVVEWPF